MLRESARGLLEKECSSAVVRKLMDDERGYDPKLWKRIAELGWTGLVLPEEFGGGGLTYVDLIVLTEEMGRVLFPSPFIWTMAFAEALMRAGSPQQKKELLPKIASGDLVATIAYVESSGRWDADGVTMTAKNADGGFTLEALRSRRPRGRPVAGRGAHRRSRRARNHAVSGRSKSVGRNDHTT